MFLSVVENLLAGRKLATLFLLLLFVACGMELTGPLLHGVFYLGYIFEGRKLPSLKEFIAMAGTFSMVSLSWIFFKSETLGDAFGYIGRIVTHPYLAESPIKTYIPMLLVSIIMLLLEWIQRKKEFAFQIENLPVIIRWCLYYGLILVVFLFGNFNVNQFIYLEF